MTMSAPIQLTDEQFAQLMQRVGPVTTTGDGGQVSAPKTASKSSVKAVRPSIDIETTEGEWAVFEDNWSRFKRMACLTSEDDIRDNLRQCCSSSLNKRLFDLKSAATLNAATEIDLLKWMMEIAVKRVHKEVHRTQFVNLRNKQGESVTAYLGRLKAESSLCDFRITAPATCSDMNCTCANHGIHVNYQDDMVATQLVAGLYNTDHKVEILSESAELGDLDKKFERLLVLEKSGTSLSTLSGGEAFSNVVSGSYPKRHQGGRRFDRNKSWREKDRQEKPPHVKPSPVSSDSICPKCKQKPWCPPGSPPIFRYPPIFSRILGTTLKGQCIRYGTHI